MEVNKQVSEENADMREQVQVGGVVGYPARKISVVIRHHQSSRKLLSMSTQGRVGKLV